MRPGADTVAFDRRWRIAATRLLLPGAVVAGAWMLYNLPFVFIGDGSRGHALLVQTALGPTIAVSLLVVSLALVEAGALTGRVRALALVAAAAATSAVTLPIVGLVMIWTGWWPSPEFALPVLWWANFGGMTMLCIGAVIVEDQRTRSIARSAALRDARLRAAEVVRRTAEVRLQAARARVEPRFLFDALAAVERAYDIDAAAGNRILDDLVTYLRAVMPDLRETPPDVNREAEIARLRRAIENAIGAAPTPVGDPA
jgi:hypothetical protein